MNTPDTLARRRVLEIERDRLRGLCDALESDRVETEHGDTAELSHMDQHQADDGSDLFESEREQSLIGRVRLDLQAVLDALDRLHRGTYGRCEACSEIIPDERLEAVPATRFCVVHEAIAEGSSATTLPGAWRYADRGIDVDDPAGREAAQHLGFLPTDDDTTERVERSSEEEAMHSTAHGALRTDEDRAAIDLALTQPVHDSD